MKKIKVYLHLIDNVPGFETVANEIADILITSELVNFAEIYIFHQYSVEGVKFNWLKDKLKEYSSVKFIFGAGYPEDYEIPTIIEIKKDADKAVEDHYVLYLHHKGVTKLGSEPEADFRAALLHYYVGNWRHFVKALDLGYDTAGINWFNGNNIYPGNYWWANSKYLKNLQNLELPSKVGKIKQLKDVNAYDQSWYRADAEYWIGTGSPRYYTIDAFPPAYSPGWTLIKSDQYIKL